MSAAFEPGGECESVFPDLSEAQAARLFGRSVDEVRAMVARGSLRHGGRRGTVDGTIAFRLARALHEKACDESWARVKDAPVGGFDIQGRSLRST